MLADGRLERAGRISSKGAAPPSTAPSLTRSASIVVVGDELLAGKVRRAWRALGAPGSAGVRISLVPVHVMTAAGMCSMQGLVLGRYVFHTPPMITALRQGCLVVHRLRWVWWDCWLVRARVATNSWHCARNS